MNYIKVLRDNLNEEPVNKELLSIAHKNHRVVATNYYWNKDNTFNVIITIDDKPKKQQL